MAAQQPPQPPSPNPAVPATTAALASLLESWAGFEPVSGLTNALRKVPTEVLRGKVTVDGAERDLLEVLDGMRHGPGLLLVIADRLKTGQVDGGTLFTVIINFCNSVLSSTLRLLPDYTIFLAERMQTLAQQLGSIALAVSPLVNLIHRYMPPHVLTPLHAELMKASLHARDYGGALELMQQDIIDIDMKQAPINYQDHLSYHYVGGIIQALCGDWKRAGHFFEIVISAPGPNTSAIQTEAYKKLILVQLLAHGRTQPLPRCTSSHLRSTYKSLSAANPHSPYGEFANAYVGATTRNEKGKRCMVIAERSKETFDKDHNWGLIQMCLRALQDRTVIALTKTYSVVSLSAISYALDWPNPTSPPSLASATALVNALVQRGQLFATIEPSPTEDGDAIVRFGEDQEEYANEAMAAKLNTVTVRQKEWRRYVEGLSKETEVSAEFLKRVLKEGREGGGSGGMMGSAGALGEEMEIEGNTGWEEDYGT